MKRLCCDGGLINIPPLLTYFYERLEQRVRVLVAEAEDGEGLLHLGHDLVLEVFLRPHSELVAARN